MDVVALDCEGVIMNSAPKLHKVCIECVREFFPISVKELNEKTEELVVRLGGESFASASKKALKLLFPEENHEEKRNKCCQMMAQRRKKIYRRVRPFPGAIEAVKRLAEEYHLVISSALERVIIDNWFKRNGFRENVFEAIYSLEDGEKSIHFQLIRTSYPNVKIFYVGDSLAEMRLGDFSIGVARRPLHQELLLTEGKARVVISSLDRIFKVLQRDY
jgi:phosphoglycolate phosphatase-like HAD superfamily hydrolase